MQKVVVLLDEFGNSHLELSKQGTFSHFVYTAIVVEESQLNQLRDKRDEISRKYFQGSIIKSSNISNNEKGFGKRLRILKELLEINFLIFSFVVNKAKVDSEGLLYKDSFYKYFNKLFLKQFPENYTSFTIYADEFGSVEFRRGLVNYLNSNVIQRSLFAPDRYYNLVDDKNGEPLIQLADFISGCVGKIYCTSHSHPESDKLFDLIYSRIIIDFFPFERINYLGSNQENLVEFDREISQISLAIALSFIENPPKWASEEIIEVLKFLILIYRTNPERLVESYEIIERLQKLKISFSEASLRQSIQTLRDNGVLISSIQGKSGYKIPYKIEDIIGFYNRYLGSVVPMLRRIKIVEENLKKKSMNKINILEISPEFDLLERLLKVVELQKTKE